MASSVQLKALTRRFAGASRPAVVDLSLDVERGEVVSLVGPSGCGKSTTLRMVAGLEVPDSGDVRIGDKSVLDVPPQSRDVAMVFQGFALYPHMQVRSILGFPLKMRKVAVPERDRAVSDAAKLLGIGALLDRRPGELSGGEQQRVAMGRALVRNPEVFLFDEPLSNLDASLRAELRVELKKLLGRLEATALYVTHDQVEAMTLSHRIAVLSKGRLEQIDTPRNIYEHPKSLFVAGFFGAPPMNLLEAELAAGEARVGTLSVPTPRSEAEALVLGFRPEAVKVSRGSEAMGPEFVRAEAKVTAVEPLGAETHLELGLDGQLFRARVAGFDAPQLGSTVTFGVAHDDVRWFDRSTGQAL
jgi:multiple sugar transport system ATP-binding protein